MVIEIGKSFGLILNENNFEMKSYLRRIQDELSQENFSLPKLVHYVRQGYYFHFDFAMTEQGPGLIFNQLFSYLSSICVPKTITLYANQLLTFPIKEFIFPGVEPIRFSFEEIGDFITILKILL